MPLIMKAVRRTRKLEDIPVFADSVFKWLTFLKLDVKPVVMLICAHEYSRVRRLTCSMFDLVRMVPTTSADGSI